MLPQFTFKHGNVGGGRKFFFVVALASLVLGAAFAIKSHAQSAIEPLQTGEASKEFEAVGRLMLAGEFICSATLIEAKLILTAAHCLVDENNTPYPAENFEFQLGYRITTARAYRKIRRLAVHPRFDVRRQMSDTVRYDVGLLEIHHRIDALQTTPLNIRRRSYDERQLRIASYARHRESTPSLQISCDLLQEDRGILVLNCPSDHGASGAPILNPSGQAELVGIVSARGTANGRNITLGVDPTSVIERLKARLGQ